MANRRTQPIIVLFLLMLPVLLATAQGGNLSSLYEEVFKGSHGLHMPKTLFALAVVAKPITTIPLSSNGPFQFDDIQGYSFPRLTNDDESSLYFYPYYGSGGNKEPLYEVFRYDKKTKAVKTGRVTDSGHIVERRYLGSTGICVVTMTGSCESIPSEVGCIQLKAEDPDVYYILNPKDLDAGANLILLSRFQPTESKLPYMAAMRDTDLRIYSRSDKLVLKDFTLPFTGMYLPIRAEVKPLQSAADQNLVFLVLYESITNDPIITVPTNPWRWHVLIYDVKGDAFYSVWHGMDESDHLPALSFSYYLGQEGLYFEVLKQGKIEIYLLDIDLKKATPLKEYETVDLLWNNKGLKELWQQKVAEAKAKDPSFEERWE